MSIRRTTSFASVAVIGALALSACDDPATAPSLSIASPSHLPGSSRAALIPNIVKYRDRGHRPALTRIGTLSLSVSALVGRDGTTDVELTPGSGPGQPVPSVAVAVIKTYAPDGKHLSTDVYRDAPGEPAVFSIAGLARDGRVRVLAQLRTPASPRGGHVDVDQIVKLRPDLSVRDVQAPSKTWTQTPTIITARLSEINGDVGARATCRLELDGAPVDSAADVWVDAGGDVSCTFALTLTDAGTHTLGVRATRVSPDDWDPGNNLATASVDVARDVAMDYDAIAVDDTIQQVRTWFRDFTTGGGYHEQARDSSGTAGRTQRASLTAYTREPLTFPEQPLTDVRLAQWSGPSQVHEASYVSLPADAAYISADSSSGCVARSDGTLVVTFTLCSRRVTRDGVVSSYTSLTYQWNAGDVTYQSRGYSTLLCIPPNPGCAPYSYSWNTATPTVQGRRITFGYDFAFEVDFTSAFTRFRSDPILTLTPTHWVVETPYACTSAWGVYPPAGRFGFLTWCTGSREEHWQLVGQQHRP